jgi:hypothetical protein
MIWIRVAEEAEDLADEKIDTITTEKPKRDRP